MLRTIAEALGIFTVSMIGLFAFYAITVKNATGIGWGNSKGLVLICVGVLYIACGTILTSIGIKGENAVKFRSIFCLLASLVLFVLAFRGGLGFTVFSYTFLLVPRYLVLAAIALLIPACVSAFAPHS